MLHGFSNLHLLRFISTPRTPRFFSLLLFYVVAIFAIEHPEWQTLPFHIGSIVYSGSHIGNFVHG